MWHCKCIVYTLGSKSLRPHWTSLKVHVNLEIIRKFEDSGSKWKGQKSDQNLRDQADPKWPHHQEINTASFVPLQIKKKETSSQIQNFLNKQGETSFSKSPVKRRLSCTVCLRGRVELFKWLWGGKTMQNDWACLKNTQITQWMMKKLLFTDKSKLMFNDSNKREGEW